MRLNQGGFIPGPSELRLPLSDDECVLDPKGRCQRTDDRHHYEMGEIHVADRVEPVDYIRTCVHRHTEPVVSGGEVVARLCLTCDEQLRP